MADRKINGIVKQALELGPTLLFFLIYLRLRDQTFSLGGADYSGFIVAALIFVPILLLSMGILWALTGKLSRLQAFTAILVLVFGGLTAWFNDERFFKMKTTLVYGLFAAVLGVGLLRGRSYLEWVMAELLPMQPEGWMILTRRLALMFAGLATANELIWRNLSTDTWVKLETFAMPLALMAFLVWQIMALQRFVIEPEDPGDG